MNYIEVTFDLARVNLTQRETLPYYLGLLGFDGVNELETQLKAYTTEKSFDRKALLDLLRELDVPENTCSTAIIPDQNWNLEWERNFNPVVIDGKCLVRAPFHKPDKQYPFEVVIEPKMSFGTGHHPTTELMAREILAFDLQQKTLLDAGCGTGILAILAEKMGAINITAVDTDEWSYRNALENTSINHCKAITVVLGDAATLENLSFEVILANINLNILIAGMPSYARLLVKNGIIFMSGILESDLEVLSAAAEKYGLIREYSKTLNNWALARFKKK
ncbi:MAG: 50S ribosomal protein L11 methyltransferase [Bacteroidales bacterium]|nr:50S ribosomal protein L11 methyltransferase [Bacteroidales bacterium]